MKKMYLTVIVALLTVCVIEGIYRMSFAEDKNEPAQETVSDFVAQVQKDAAILNSDFNKFFNEEFFKNTQDPFKEMENARKMMRSKMMDHTMNSFDDSWNNWYNGRFGGAAISIKTEDTKDSVVMRIKVDGLQKNNLDINIDKDRVKIECNVKEIKEEQDTKGNKTSSYTSEQHITRMLSLPKGVDSSKAVTKQDNNEIIITFPKK